MNLRRLFLKIPASTRGHSILKMIAFLDFLVREMKNINNSMIFYNLNKDIILYILNLYHKYTINPVNSVQSRVVRSRGARVSYPALFGKIRSARSRLSLLVFRQS